MTILFFFSNSVRFVIGATIRTFFFMNKCLLCSIYKYRTDQTSIHKEKTEHPMSKQYIKKHFKLFMQTLKDYVTYIQRLLNKNKESAIIVDLVGPIFHISDKFHCDAI